MKKELTREELIAEIAPKGLAESFLETFTTEELRDGYLSFDGPYIYLTALHNARNN